MISRIFHLRLAKPVVVASVVLVLVVASFFAIRKAAPKGSYNLGRIPLAAEIIHEFVVSNPFPDRLVLSGVRTTHPDTTIVAYDPVILPHGQGSVRVRLSPTEVGPLQARFFLDYRGSRHGLRQLAFHGDVIPPALAAPEATPAPDLLISASELLAILNLPDPQTPVVVDIRGADDYQRSHLPESLNMPSFQLKASQHLKKRPVIVIDESLTTQSVAQLEKSGFESVRILDGGIPAWQALGAPLMGSERGLPVEVSPAVFLQAASQEGWRVVDVRTKAQPLPISAPSIRVPLTSLQSPDAGAAPKVANHRGNGRPARLETEHRSKISVTHGRDAHAPWKIPAIAIMDAPPAAIQKLGLSPSSKVLILTDQGVGRESLRTFTDAMKGFPLYFVRGGADAINRELLQIARSQIKPATASINGTAIASNQRFSRSIGGCRSCP